MHIYLVYFQVIDLAVINCVVYFSYHWVWCLEIILGPSKKTQSWQEMAMAAKIRQTGASTSDIAQSCLPCRHAKKSSRKVWPFIHGRIILLLYLWTSDKPTGDNSCDVIHETFNVAHCLSQTHRNKFASLCRA